MNREEQVPEQLDKVRREYLKWSPMGKGPKIVCLCGSTRFSEEFRQANLRETLAGHIVLTIGVDTKSDADLLLAGDLTLADKERLDGLHLRKIDLADEVVILNVNGYVGESTQHEIEYARVQGKPIRWLEPEHAWNGE